jgi:hypothetical protein
VTEATSPAKLRLAASRKALARQMLRHRRADAQREPNPFESGDGSAPASGGSGPLSLLTHALGIWWQRQPAYSLWLIGRSAVQHYAGQKPLQMLGIAAGIGALAILLKPWRHAPLAKLAVATLGSAHVTGLLRSLLATDGRPEGEQKP